MSDDDWMLAQGTVEFRDEERRHRNRPPGPQVPKLWQCPACFCWSFLFRPRCFKCKAPKP